MSQVFALHKTNICEEEPVEVILNGKPLVTFMCTRKNLKELAIGHLYSRGIIKTLEDISTLVVCRDNEKIYILLNNELENQELSLGDVLTSSCGNGIAPTFNNADIPKITGDFQITLDKIKKQTREMFSLAEMYKIFGGMHCASLSDGKNIIALSEDVGRHNAVDKTIGKGLSLNIDFEETFFMTTGRISADMVLKAAHISCPVIASRSIPTTSALELAEKFGISIIGRAASAQPIVYINDERIVN